MESGILIKMKKFCIIAGSVLILIALTAVVLALTFDVNRYKGVLIEKLEESTGKDAAIDNISISFSRGFGVEIKGVAIKDKGADWGKPLLKAGNLNISVKILPLLKKDIQISRLFIPELRINPGSNTAFKCSVDLNSRISINNLRQEDMLKTLTANGTVKLEKAVLENVNVLKTILNGLSMLPNLVQKLKDNLPERYSALLNQNYTAFKPVKADFVIRDGKIIFDKVTVESDFFYLMNTGYFNMIDQNLQIDSDLFIPKDLSNVFSGITPEFKYITDDNGLITMPLDIRGKLPDISIVPDLNYILQRLFTSKGQELLNKFFNSK
jgi:hypothetical protein